MNSTPTRLRIADLATRKPTRFSLLPEEDDRLRIAKDLNLSELRKLRFEGEIAPVGGRDWVLRASLGATVVQPCVVTLDPVVTRLDEELSRTFIADYQTPEAGEVEMPEDDTVDPLPAVLDLTEIMVEALSLALPQFPRADGVELGEAVFAAEGVDPMTDEDAKPFAGLGALKAQLSGKDS